MKKKVFAAVLAASMLMMTACGSTQETTVSSNSEETTAEVTTEATAETTEGESEVIESEASQDDVIIPLYYSGKENEIRQVNPADFYDFSNFTTYFYPVTPAGRTLDNGFELKTISYGSTFTLSADPIDGVDESFEVQIYFYCGDLDTMMYEMYYEVGDTSGVMDSFIPLWYNQTKGCLVGYNRLNNEGEISYVLYEVYYSPIMGSLSRSQAVDDSSLYGF